MLGFDYVAAKAAFFNFLEVGVVGSGPKGRRERGWVKGKGRGTWLRRPVEEQMFH